MATLIDRYIDSERLRDVKAVRPGESLIDGAVHYATACSYLTTLNRYIMPQWGHFTITEIKAAAVEEWLKSLHRLPKPDDVSGVKLPLLSPKTRGNIKAMLHRLIEKAMLWDLIPVGRNPMGLVEIKGVSKRSKKPFVLTVEQYQSVSDYLMEPYKPMVHVAMCLGLRVSEVLALRWSDFDFATLTLSVVRGAVHGRVGDCKTEYSEDELPLDASFAALMLDWKTRCPKSEGDWVFPNPNTGEVFHASPIQQDYIRAAGRKANLPRDIGWHTFRHTYRSFLDEGGAPVGVQQKLMRHAQVSTTMNLYGNAQMHSKRTANTKVVQMVLPNREPLREAV